MQKLREHCFEIEQSSFLDSWKRVSLLELLPDVGADFEDDPDFPGCTCPCPEEPEMANSKIALFVNKIVVGLSAYLNPERRSLSFRIGAARYEAQIISPQLYVTTLQASELPSFLKKMLNVNKGEIIVSAKLSPRRIPMTASIHYSTIGLIQPAQLREPINR